MEKRSLKGWLYLLPALLFLGIFMVYPLVDVFIYSFEEGYNSASQTFFGVGGYNYSYVLHDPYFLQALKNTFILVIILHENIYSLARRYTMSRVILHADANSFYATVECLYNPDLRDKPVAVCGDPEERHGIVLAKNNDFGFRKILF